MQELLEEAKALAGREVEVEQTADGKYIVLWMCFEKSPPPKGDTPEEALKGFIEYRKKENTDGAARADSESNA